VSAKQLALEVILAQRQMRPLAREWQLRCLALLLGLQHHPTMPGNGRHKIISTRHIMKCK